MVKAALATIKDAGTPLVLGLVLIGLIAIVAYFVWLERRARRRAMVDVCLKCGYDLRGLAVGAPCPECGGLDKGASVS